MSQFQAVLRYSAGAMALHWLVALLIFVSFGMGLMFDDIPKSWESWLLNTHGLVGSAILALVALRLAWRLGNPPPALPDDLAMFERRGAHATHVLLYVMMFTVPLLGLIALFARGKGLDFGLFYLGSPLERARDLARNAKGLHMLASYAMMALVALHFAAAMYHHFVRRDGLLRRMLPAGK